MIRNFNIYKDKFFTPMLLLSTLILFLKDAETNPTTSHSGHSGNDFEFIKTIFQGRNISFDSIDKIQELLRHISNDNSKPPSTINNRPSLIDIFKIHFQSKANDSNPSEESTELQKIKNKLAEKSMLQKSSVMPNRIYFFI